MTVDIDRGAGDNKSRRDGRSHVTIIGTPLRASAMAAVAGRIADAGANIERIERMARYPVTAIDLHVSGADTDALRTVLAAEAAVQGVDIAVQPANLLRRGTRLIVMDVDSTLIQGEVIEMLAAHAGYEAEVALVTAAAMRGELDFEESLRSRVALLAGVPATALDEVYDAIVLAPGPDPGADPTSARLPVRPWCPAASASSSTAGRGPRHPLLARQRARDRRRRAHRRILGPWSTGPGRRPRCASSRPRSASRGRDHRHRRRRQRPRHAQRRRAGHRLQRQAARPGRRGHLRQRPLPRRDHVPPRISREEIVAADAEAGFVTPRRPSVESGPVTVQ